MNQQPIGHLQAIAVHAAKTLLIATSGHLCDDQSFGLSQALILF
ncbi:hypothetical protein [Halioxenophilus sp. WMMB6]|nr:hypothetical protein [Halioxenophilus sp. WMMB6]